MALAVAFLCAAHSSADAANLWSPHTEAIALPSNTVGVRMPRRPPPFGRPMLAEFMLADNFTNLNHGSFGATPRSVIEAQRRWIDRAEARPDDWFRRDYRDLLDTLRGRVAAVIGADTDDVTFVENASAAMNAVFRTLIWGDGDAVLILDTAYGMVKNTLKFVAEQSGVEVITVEVPLPLEDDSAIDDALRAALRQHEGKRIRMASFSHITSVPALILPVERLAALCLQNGVGRVVVDGAHALGNIEVDMRELEEAGIDFWVGNGHKWLYSPKGSAVLWVAPAAQDKVAPTVISSEWGGAGYLRSFQYTGTRDYTPFVAVGDALDFREQVGGAEIMAYMRELSAWATEHLSRAWGTEAIAPAHMTAMSMSNVRVPTTDPEKAATLASRVYDEYDIYIVVYRAAGDQWWVRLSAQIYLEKDDFVRMGEAVLAVLAE